MKDVLPEERSHYVIENLKLVNMVLNHLRVPSYLYDDLYQEGCLGLTIAATRFDENKDYKFSTYAVPYIKGYILDEWNKYEDMINSSARAREYKVAFYKYQTNHIGASDQEILDALKIPRQYWEVVTGQYKVESIEKMMEFDSARDDDSDDPSDIGIDNLQSIINKSLGNCNESSRNIYLDYINGVMSGEEVTFRELGKRYGVSFQRVQQIIQKINKRMKILLKDYRR